MDKIYETYGMIYQEILPQMEYIPLQENFLHFEKYDYRFHWNKKNSIIEIWLPIKGWLNSYLSGKIKTEK